MLLQPVIASIEERGIFLPLIHGTGEAGATVHLTSSIGREVTTVVDTDGNWSAVPEVVVNTDGAFRVSAYQVRGDMASASSAESAEIVVPVPTVNSFQGAVPNSQLTFDGPDGSTIEVGLDNASTKDFYDMNGTSRSILLSTPIRDLYIVLLRFVDRTTGRYGATVAITLVAEGPP